MADVAKKNLRKNYDVIIIGAGSIGTPTAFYLSRSGFSTLVIDSEPSVGQGSNKRAIGGIRATHSDPAKIALGLRSIEIFSTWKESFGDEIEWVKGGYCFVAYRDIEKKSLQELLKKQRLINLNIDWFNTDDLLEIVPALNKKNLLGGTFSPDDGNASPLLAIHAFYTHSIEMGSEYRFREKVTGFINNGDKVTGVITDREKYFGNNIIIAAGANSREIGHYLSLDIPVFPDSHEAGISEPVERFLNPMIVDLRPNANSSNFYFYQHYTGQLVFCVTPSPNIWGTDIRETSSFLPLAANRLIDVIPRLFNIRIRRTWRGLYPMTPDGFPLVGEITEKPGIILATGMCGQGFMLGPGIAELLVRLISGNLNPGDKMILEYLSPYREFDKQEILK